MNNRSWIFIFGGHTRWPIEMLGKYFSSSGSEVWDIAIFPGFPGFPGNPGKFNISCPQHPHAGGPRPSARKPQHGPYEVDHIVGWCRGLGFRSLPEDDFPRISWEFPGSWEIRNRPARVRKNANWEPAVFFQRGEDTNLQDLAVRVPGEHFMMLPRWHG